MKNPRRRGWDLGISSLKAFLLAASLWCSAGIRAEAQRFIARSWQSEDGLPSNTVRAVVQAADGYLWIATPEGVVRFDGIRFSRLAEDNVVSSFMMQCPRSSAFSPGLGANSGAIRYGGAWRSD